MTTYFENPDNGYVVQVSTSDAFLVLLFGSLYFAAKGVWSHAIVSLIVAIATIGISWLVYPFFTRSIMEDHYLKMGWRELFDEDFDEPRRRPRKNRKQRYDDDDSDYADRRN